MSIPTADHVAEKLWKKQLKNGRIPSPPNSFLLFRNFSSERHQALEGRAVSETIHSRIMTFIWRNLGEQEKTRWKELERDVRLKHKQRFPEYKRTINRK